ncbi:unnamed protein product [Merluccius merluccius]
MSFRRESCVIALLALRLQKGNKTKMADGEKGRTAVTHERKYSTGKGGRAHAAGHAALPLAGGPQQPAQVPPPAKDVWHHSFLGTVAQQ